MLSSGAMVGSLTWYGMSVLFTSLMVCLFGLAFESTGTPESGASERDIEPKGSNRRIGSESLERTLEKSGTILVDVRSAVEIAENGTLEGYVHIPVDELEERVLGDPV